MTHNLTAPDFVAGKALFLRKISGSWSVALKRACWYASIATRSDAKAMWTAVAKHIEASHV